MNTTNINTQQAKRDATFAGIFFIIAAVSAIAGLKLYDPVLATENFLEEGAKHHLQIIGGAISELILACTAVGTGLMLYPYLKKHHEGWGLGYVCFRMLEVVFILVGIVSVLGVLSLSRDFQQAQIPEKEVYRVTGRMLKSIHDWTFMLGPNFMLGINTFIYSLIFYRSGLVPKKLALLGIAGAVFILIAALLEMFGLIAQLSGIGVVLALPIFIYEMTLAVWLMVKGFGQRRTE